MIIHNQNNVYRPVFIELQEQWQVKRLKEVLNYAKEGIKVTKYCFNEEDLNSFIDKMLEGIK